MEFFESESWKNNYVSDSFVRKLIEIAKTGENYREIAGKNEEFSIKNLLLEAKVLVDRHNFVVLSFILNPKYFEKLIGQLSKLPKTPSFEIYSEIDNTIKSIHETKVKIWGADIYVSEELSEYEILAYCNFGSDARAISLVKAVYEDV